MRPEKCYHLERQMDFEDFEDIIISSRGNKLNFSVRWQHKMRGKIIMWETEWPRLTAALASAFANSSTADRLDVFNSSSAADLKAGITL